MEMRKIMNIVKTDNAFYVVMIEAGDTNIWYTSGDTMAKLTDVTPIIKFVWTKK